MFFKRVTTAAAAAALLAFPIERATADTAGGFIAGALIGGIIGNEIGKNNSKQRRVVRQRTYTTKKKRYSSVSPAVRAERREIQTSLNYFGFPVGSADGVLGRKSRAGISNYQAHMGYPITGYLTDYEKNFLLTSYRRAIAGGAATNQLIAANPQGPRGLLHTYRDEAAGVTTVTTTTPVTTAPTTTVVVSPAAPATPAPTPLPTTTLAAAPADTGTSALPNFLGGENIEEASLASHCNQVSLLTSTNGYTTVAAMTDPNAVLNEQFCLARTYAISDGESRAAKVQGFSPQQIAAQCEGFGPAMQQHIVSLSTKSQAAVLSDVSGFVLGTGMAPAQLAGTAKICLSVGYRTDNLDVALASGLILASLGEAAYGELMAHHLSQGFGTSKRPDLAMGWYEMSLGALEGGAQPVFAPGQPERTALVRKASFALDSNSSQAQPNPVQPTSALPTFNLDN